MAGLDSRWCIAYEPLRRCRFAMYNCKNNRMPMRLNRVQHYSQFNKEKKEIIHISRFACSGLGFFSILYPTYRLCAFALSIRNCFGLRFVGAPVGVDLPNR